MIPSAFLKNSRFAHFGQKLSKIGHFGRKCQKMEVFHIFLGIPALLFSENSQLIRAKLAIWLDVCTTLFKGWESLKNLKVGVFKTDFKQFPFVLRQTTHTYSESWRPLENFFDPTPPGVGGRKNDPKTQICVKKIFPYFCLKNLVSLLKIDFD